MRIGVSSSSSIISGQNNEGLKLSIRSQFSGECTFPNISSVEDTSSQLISISSFSITALPSTEKEQTNKMRR